MLTLHTRHYRHSTDTRVSISQGTEVAHMRAAEELEHLYERKLAIEARYIIIRLGAGGG